MTLSYQPSALSYQIEQSEYIADDSRKGAKGAKFGENILTADTRRLTQTRKQQSAKRMAQNVKDTNRRFIHRRDAEKNQRSDVRGRRSLREWDFCLSQDDDKQKHTSSKD